MLASPSPEPSPTPPADTPPTPEPTAAPSPEPPAPSPEPAAPLTWPQWFAPADIALSIMAVVVAFLAASFPVRNADFFLHLATGRLVAEGGYSPGTDPYSHVAPDRPWVNWSWLTELGMYAAYSADPSGTAVVAGKAAAVAVAFALLFLLRRPGHALWPWALTATLGALAAGTVMSARPTVASVLFLSVTLLILHRADWRGGSWKWPGVLAAVFALWANCDAWFFLGPVAVWLMLLGEWVQQKLVADDASDPSADSPLYPPPPLKQLARAAVVGTAVCLLNPSFLVALTRSPGDAVAQIVPVELDFTKPAGLKADPDLSPLATSPLDLLFGESKGFYPFVTAYAALVVLGGVVLALGFSGSRASQVVLWVGFAAPALVNVRLLPFFAVVAVPITASQFNLLSLRARLRTWTDTPTRILLVGSGLGRIFSITAVMAAIFAAYPGWLHPVPADPANAQYVAWQIEPDAGLTRSAERIARWREDGRLPESFKGLHVSPDLADYLAWHAPKEKVFVNSRLRYHAAELPDLLAVRKAVLARQFEDDPRADADRIEEVSGRYGAAYLVVGTKNRQISVPMPFTLTFELNAWAFWHLDGRLAVLGRAAARPENTEAFDRLAFDPAALAFGPDVERLPDGVVADVPPKERPPEERYVLRPPPAPPAADDVQVWEVYSRYAERAAGMRWMTEASRERMAILPGLSAVVAFGGALFGTLGDPPVTPTQFAMPVLMVRAARTAIAAAPDRPDCYLALAVAYRQQYATPSSEGDRQLQVVTAQARFLERVPPPEKTGSQYAMLVAQEAELLTRAFLERRQLDLAREALRKAIAYVEVTSLAEYRLDPSGKENPKTRRLEELRTQEERLSDQIVLAKNRLQGVQDPARRFGTAVGMGLTADAIEQFKSTEQPKETYGQSATGIALQLIELELNAGRLEDAVADLEALRDEVDNLAEASKRDPATAGVVASVRALRAQAARLAGDHTNLIDYRFENAAASLRRLRPEEVSVLTRPLAIPVLGTAVAAGPPSLVSLPYAPVVEAAEVIRQEGATRMDCGMIAVESGDLDRARTLFEQAKAPQGVPLAAVLSPQHLDLLLRLTALFFDPRQVEGVLQQHRAVFSQLRQSAGKADLYLDLIRQYHR